jgi:C4-dicarboxylate-specific signal transduction histidine kinase
MEAAVLKSREMLQSVFDGISDPLVVLDGELKVELLNRAASVYYSIFDKNIIGLHCYHALLNKERCCHNCPINQVFSEKKVVSIERKGLMDPERKEKVVLYPILTAESARCSVIIRISDITDAKFMERQIMQREKLASVGELAAGVAHEINNPINGIINYAQILLDEADQHSETAEIPARIIKEGERIASIVRNLLSFSRQSDDAAAPASVRRIVDDALELMGKQLSNDGIHLYKNIGDDLPQVRVNAQKIQQVFVNLISNARHALNQKYPGLDRDKLLRIDARVEKIGDHAFVRVVFHDHGMGIPARHMGKIFDPFFSTKPRGIGTGLGLTISHEIIKDINGNLTFESEEGKYTDAIVDLPAAE